MKVWERVYWLPVAIVEAVLVGMVSALECFSEFLAGNHKPFE